VMPRSLRRLPSVAPDCVRKTVDFLIHSRGSPDGPDGGPDLDERHWAYLDRFADQMTARGPTLAADRDRWTGSMHIVNLPGPHAAREFVALEPYNQAGLYADHVIWRFLNLLATTMWQFAGAPGEPRYLILATARPVPVMDLSPQLRAALIVYGELRNLDDDESAGIALAVQASSRAALEALLLGGRVGLADLGQVAIHDWEFGGRR
jgi:uncharacterized protein